MEEVAAEFSDGEDSELIEAISHYPEIFNPSHEGYRKVAVKEQHWDLIAKRLKKPTELCKRRWKNHRDNYFKQKRLSKKHGKPRKRNSILNKLSFLENVGARCRMLPKNKKQEISASDNANNFVVELDSSCEIPAHAHEYIIEESEEDGSFDPHVTQSCNLVDQADVNDSKASAHIRSLNTAGGGPWESVKVSTNALLELIKRGDQERDHLRRQVFSLQSKQNDTSELGLFMRCISETIRKFPPSILCDVKAKIFGVISEAEMKLCQSTDGGSSSKSNMNTAGDGVS